MLLLSRETDPYSSMLTEPELPQECNRYVTLSPTHTHSHTQVHVHVHMQMTETEDRRKKQESITRVERRLRLCVFVK